MTEKVVITGMGAISPIGNTVAESWEAALNGVSGVAPVTRANTSDQSVHIACEVKNFIPEDFIDAKEIRRRDLFTHFAMVAVREALAQSGLVINPDNSDRIGMFVSSALGGLESVEAAVRTQTDKGSRRVNPFTVPMYMLNGAAGSIAIDLGINGQSASVATACASGGDSIGLGWMLLRAGTLDAAIVGASDAPITSVGMAAFDRLGAMSRRNDDYSSTPQPFDLHRDGFVLGEGAGVLILERESTARARGAEILAELAGYGATSDAYHITAPAEGGTGGAQATKLALASAEAPLDSVGYINAHGTATGLNDKAETLAIKSVFGELAYNIPVSSTKSMTGHMMGATGGLEAIFCVKAVQENRVPPTIHYQTPDPDCDLDYVPNTARDARVECAVNNSFGFGGHNAVVVIKKYH
ncbi:MAG: beta-ketoacyl-ACP synthase II [Anaerolineales bacterium]|nr:beta-ketoacyl-ACP synthase II [Anaerolineales bacterium]